MTTRALGRSRAADIPRPELHAAGRIAVTFLVLLSLGAIAGGIALTAKPDGGVMGSTSPRSRAARSRTTLFPA